MTHITGLIYAFINLWRSDSHSKKVVVGVVWVLFVSFFLVLFLFLFGVLFLLSSGGVFVVAVLVWFFIRVVVCLFFTKTFTASFPALLLCSSTRCFRRTWLTSA